MRSESRTEETSGLVTTTAASAWRIASVAPRSMPAGLSQITQSNFSRNSPITRCDALCGQRVLVAGLRGRQQRQRLDALVADQRLRQLGVALHDVDEVEHDAALGAHHEVEVAQADIEIDDHHAAARSAPAPRRARRWRSSCRRRLCRMSRPRPWPSASPSLLRQSSAAIVIVSPSSQACTGRPRSAGLHVVGGAVEPVDRQQLGFEAGGRRCARGGLPASPAIARPRSVP